MCCKQALQVALSPERLQQLDTMPLQAGEVAAQLLLQPAHEPDAEAALLTWHLAPPEPPPDPKAKVLPACLWCWHAASAAAALTDPTCGCHPRQESCLRVLLVCAGRQEEVILDQAA